LLPAAFASPHGRGPSVIQQLVENLESRMGNGPVSLAGVAFNGTAQVP
jgi:hypothetical protein